MVADPIKGIVSVCENIQDLGEQYWLYLIGVAVIITCFVIYKMIW